MDYKNRHDFVKHRNIYFFASAAVIAIGLVFVLVFGMHYGVDFKSGTSLDMALGKPAERAQVEQMLAEADLSPVILTMGGANNERFSARYDEVLTEEQVKMLTEKFAGVFGDQISSEVNTVSPDMANEMKRKAFIAVGIASLAVSLYVTIRFEWRFALSAIVTILYDAVFVIVIFSIFQLEVDLPFIAAVLTTIGYSINDKIVILDRIRENLRFSKLKTDADLAELVNRSIWQTMSRSINTVVTVLIAAICLYLFGSESIKLFALAKMIGLVSGVYSSICLATPMWYLLKRSTLKAMKAAPAKANP